MTSDKTRARQGTVPDGSCGTGRVRGGREINGEPAVRSVHAHRAEDFPGVNADAGPGSNEPGAVDGKMQAGEHQGRLKAGPIPPRAAGRTGRASARPGGGLRYS